MSKNSLKISFKALPFVLAVVITLSFSFSEGSYENSTAIGVKDKPDRFMLVNNLNYGLSSDAVDNNDRKVFNHGLAYSGTLFVEDTYYANFGLAATYHSVDDSLVQDDNGTFHLSDLVAGLGTKGVTLYQTSKESIKLFNNIRNVFPLSERSRNEGYKAVPSVSGDLAYQRGALGLVLTGQYSYVLNDFETNLDGLYNLRSSSIAGLTLRYNYKRFRFQYSYRLGVLEYMDGLKRGASGNTLSLMAMFEKNIWAGLSTSNMNTIEDQFVDVWFYDPFRRIYNLRLGVTF